MRNAILLAVLALVGLGVVSAALASSEVPSPLAGAPSISGRGGEQVAITWLGDTLLADGADPLIDEHGPSWPGALLPPLEFDHVVIANLEGPLTDRTEPFDPLQRWSYNVRPEAAPALAAMGIDAVSLANNHAMDRGPGGLDDTSAHARAAGIESFGAGATSDEARLPLLVDSEFARIGVLGFSDESGDQTASSERPGVRSLTENNLRADIDRARAGGVDRVVAFVHWGKNYDPVNDRQRAWAQAFADAGYDVVVGTGPHIPQPIEHVDGMPVVYSIGNYVFGTPGRFVDESQGFGLVLTTTFDGTDELTLTARCIQTNNELVDYQPVPCEPLQEAAVLATVNTGFTPTLDGTAADGTTSNGMTMVVSLPARSR